MSPTLSRRLAAVTPILRDMLPPEVYHSSILESDAQTLEDLPDPIPELVQDLEKILARTDQ